MSPRARGNKNRQRRCRRRRIRWWPPLAGVFGRRRRLLGCFARPARRREQLGDPLTAAAAADIGGWKSRANGQLLWPPLWLRRPIQVSTRRAFHRRPPAEAPVDGGAIVCARHRRRSNWAHTRTQVCVCVPKSIVRRRRDLSERESGQAGRAVPFDRRRRRQQWRSPPTGRKLVAIPRRAPERQSRPRGQEAAGSASCVTSAAPDAATFLELPFFCLLCSPSCCCCCRFANVAHAATATGGDDAGRLEPVPAEPVFGVWCWCDLWRRRAHLLIMSRRWRASARKTAAGALLWAGNLGLLQAGETWAQRDFPRRPAADRASYRLLRRTLGPNICIASASERSVPSSFQVSPGAAVVVVVLVPTCSWPVSCRFLSAATTAAAKQSGRGGSGFSQLARVAANEAGRTCECSRTPPRHTIGQRFAIVCPCI